MKKANELLDESVKHYPNFAKVSFRQHLLAYAVVTCEILKLFQCFISHVTTVSGYVWKQYNFANMTVSAGWQTVQFHTNSRFE